MGTEKGGKKPTDIFLSLLLTKQGEVSKKGLKKESGKMMSVFAAGAVVVEIPVLDYLLLHKDSPYPIPPQRQQ